MKILIVKTSSLGDIIQTFPVLTFLHENFPGVTIDWLVEADLLSVVANHPLVHCAIPISTKKSWSCIFAYVRKMREKKYQFVFDLQGNSKSGLWTFVSRSEKKIGLSLASAREWPNILSTNIRFTVPTEKNVRLQNLSLLEQFFKTTATGKDQLTRFSIDPVDQALIQNLLQQPQIQSPCRIMVCPGAKWQNKRLTPKTWLQLLKRIHQNYNVSFLFIWGTEGERLECATMQEHFQENSLLLAKLSIPAWQYLMSEVDLVLAVDSSALHLCGTTKTPSFSVFGPTSSSIFKPIGAQHVVYQGSCPYQKSFERTCPILRTCKTGACIRSIDAEDLFRSFTSGCGDALALLCK